MYSLRISEKFIIFNIFGNHLLTLFAILSYSSYIKIEIIKDGIKNFVERQILSRVFNGITDCILVQLLLRNETIDGANISELISWVSTWLIKRCCRYNDVLEHIMVSFISFSTYYGFETSDLSPFTCTLFFKLILTDINLKK